MSDKSYNNKCKPPLAMLRGKLPLHVKLIQADEQKLKNQSPKNCENPFALSFKANFTIIHA